MTSIPSKVTEGWLYELRQAWARLADEALVRCGLRATLDHRSYAMRGLPMQPQLHLGQGAAQMRKLGIDTVRGKKFDEIEKRRLEDLELMLADARRRRVVRELELEVMALDQSQRAWQLNAFDFVATVALGSTLAAILLNSDVTLLQGGVALAMLIALQFVVPWASVRSTWVRKLVTGEASLLVFRGELLHMALRKGTVTEAEVLAAIRSAGLGSYDEAEAVVLETDASFSVIRGRENCDNDGELPSLAGVRRP